MPPQRERNAPVTEEVQPDLHPEWRSTAMDTTEGLHEIAEALRDIASASRDLVQAYEEGVAQQAKVTQLMLARFNEPGGGASAGDAGPAPDPAGAPPADTPEKEQPGDDDGTSG
jgi:hypothetical protein